MPFLACPNLCTQLPGRNQGARPSTRPMKAILERPQKGRCEEDTGAIRTLADSITLARSMENAGAEYQNGVDASAQVNPRIEAKSGWIQFKGRLRNNRQSDMLACRIRRECEAVSIAGVTSVQHLDLRQAKLANLP
eukprot:2997558-Amphidinium_carterae.1